MNHQGQLIRLKRLTNDIVNERIALMGGAPGARTGKHAELAQKIDAWSQTVEELTAALGRSLKSRSHFNHMVYQQQRFSPHAYSARQSFQSKEANIRDVSQALMDLEEALRDLMSAFFTGNGPEAKALEGIADVMSNWMKRVKHADEGIMGPVPVQLQTAVVQAYEQSPAGGARSAPPTVIDIFTLLLAYIVLLKSFNKSK
ncbi:hypothetical protein MWU54_00685 [Marivita sp. S6314]|uniref:hypothetical protein n=1 Tax=Marivita sp. S6314 TaxID=2926406 RepID=UPI001FF11372|nr:hypothetical protein [Marivita sp. S6314]MCK0148525.1 hypothetical protein [Marivita sp. S6314]